MFRAFAKYGLQKFHIGCQLLCLFHLDMGQYGTMRMHIRSVCYVMLCGEIPRKGASHILSCPLSLMCVGLLYKTWDQLVVFQITLRQSMLQYGADDSLCAAHWLQTHTYQGMNGCSVRVSASGSFPSRWSVIIHAECSDICWIAGRIFQKCRTNPDIEVTAAMSPSGAIILKVHFSE